MVDQTQSDAYQKSLASSQNRFLASLPEKLDALLAQVSATQAPSSQEHPARKLHRLIHDIAGNAAMLGFSDIEAAIREGLPLAEAADKESRQLTPTETGVLAACVDKVRAMAASPHETRAGE